MSKASEEAEAKYWGLTHEEQLVDVLVRRLDEKAREICERTTSGAHDMYAGAFYHGVLTMKEAAHSIADELKKQS